MKPAITAFESAAMMLIFWFIIILVIPFIGLHEFVKHYRQKSNLTSHLD
jgi:hypothetical protein